MLTRGHRSYSIAFLALVLAAFALPALLVAGCEPTPPATPAASATSPASTAVASGSTVQAPASRATPATTASGCTQTPASGPQNWTQLCQFLSGYNCAFSTGGVNCAPSDAFILAGAAGPAKPLYSLVNGTTLQTTQLIASTTKMPAAAAILTALYNAPKYNNNTTSYTIDTPVSTIVANYLAANKAANQNTTAFKDAKTFQTAWNAMVSAIPKKFPTPPNPAPSSITIKHLLSMTSGFTTMKKGNPVPPCMNDSLNPPNTDSCAAKGGTSDTSPYADSLACCAAQIANPNAQYVVFTPGSEFGYSFAGFQVAGYVATLLPTGSGAYPHAGDWISFFNSTFSQPLGLLCPASSTSTSCYSYANDLVANPQNPSPPGTSVTNPRISGGGSCDAYSYSTILTMILNGGNYNGKVVLPTSVISELTTNQLPQAWWANEKLPDLGMKPTGVIYYAPTDAASFRGYSFGLFMPTSTGMPPTIPGFFDSLSTPQSAENSPLVPLDFTVPPTGTVFLDPGAFGAAAWFNTGSGPRFSAVNIIFKYLGDLTGVGLDMMRTANSAISCQFQSPGLMAPYPSPINGSYCAASTP